MISLTFADSLKISFLTFTHMLLRVLVYTVFFFVCVFSLCFYWSIIAFLIAQLAKNLPPMQETLVRFLGWDDPLEKG